jgi:hypothetical protein
MNLKIGDKVPLTTTTTTCDGSTTESVDLIIDSKSTARLAMIMHELENINDKVQGMYEEIEELSIHINEAYFLSHDACMKKGIEQQQEVGDESEKDLKDVFDETIFYSPYKLGDTIVVGGAEPREIVLSSKVLVVFANSASRMQAHFYEVFEELKEAQQLYEIDFNNLIHHANELEIVDSIVQHCLTGS